MSPPPDVPDTWFSGDLKILTAIVARVETEGSATLDTVLADTGLDSIAVDRGTRALERAGYFHCSWDGGGDYSVMEISERARREVGTWPTAEVLATRLIDALERIASNSGSAVEREAAGKVLDVVTTDGRGVVVNALGNLISGAITGLT